MKYLIKSLLLTLIITANIIFPSTYSTNALYKEPEHSNSNSSKVVYLTFDDGPSENTPLILDILKEHDVKATFFIISPYIESHISIVTRAFNEGHSIGNHTADHEFQYVYTSEDAFFKSFYKQQKFIEETTGKSCTIFRFPGGSRNTIVRSSRGKEFTNRLIEKLSYEGIKCYDWNVDSGDATSNNIPPANLCRNIITELSDKDGNLKDPAIVLMHDCMTKKTTVQALPEIIKIFKERGYQFKTLD